MQATDYRDIAENCLAARLRRGARRVSAIYDEYLAAAGVSVTQFTLLNALAVAPRTPVSALADILGMDRTTLTRNLATLESRGWVKRVPGEADRRERCAVLTPVGRNTLAEAYPYWKQAQQNVRGRYTKSELEALRRTLRRLEDHYR